MKRWGHVVEVARMPTQQCLKQSVKKGGNSFSYYFHIPYGLQDLTVLGFWPCLGVLVDHLKLQHRTFFCSSLHIVITKTYMYVICILISKVGSSGKNVFELFFGDNPFPRVIVWWNYLFCLLASSIMSLSSSSVMVSPSSRAIFLRLSKVMKRLFSWSNSWKALSISSFDSFSFCHNDDCKVVYHLCGHDLQELVIVDIVGVLLIFRLSVQIRDEFLDLVLLRLKT